MMNPSIRDKEPSVGDLASILDNAESLKRFQEEVKDQLNIGERKGEIKTLIIKAASERGVTLTGDQAEAAVESWFDGLYRFREPAHNLQYKLA